MKKLIAGITIGIVLIAGLALGLYSTGQRSSDEVTTQAATQEKSEEAEETEVMSTGSEDVPISLAPYIDLKAYTENVSLYASVKKVYFFHASWCPICKSIEKSIETNPELIPADTVFIKVDFDTETSLREKYGVTTQYSFVQIDESGNELKQWSATSLERAINQVQ